MLFGVGCLDDVDDLAVDVVGHLVVVFVGAALMMNSSRSS